MKGPKLVFHDVDGTRYYMTATGDVPLHVEENIRRILALQKQEALR